MYQHQERRILVPNTLPMLSRIPPKNGTTTLILNVIKMKENNMYTFTQYFNSIRSAYFIILPGKGWWHSWFLIAAIASVTWDIFSKSPPSALLSTIHPHMFHVTFLSLKRLSRGDLRPPLLQMHGFVCLTAIGKTFAIVSHALMLTVHVCLCGFPTNFKLNLFIHWLRWF